MINDIVSLFDVQQPWSVLCLKSSAYSSIFFTDFFTCFLNYDLHGDLKNYEIISINFKEFNAASFEAALQISFLGSLVIYWCHDISVLTSDQRKQFMVLIKNYVGPHKIIFFAPSALDISLDLMVRTIVLEDMLDERSYQAYYNFLHTISYKVAPGTADFKINNFATVLFERQKKISLDDACRLMYYNKVLDNNDRLAQKVVVDQLIKNDSSLFTLAQYLYARDCKQFMKFWHAIGNHYPLEFWITFWAEQLWQAQVFLEYRTQADYSVARTKVNRLPFSFMQKDYKNYKKRELSLAYNFLYSVDCGSKNGYATFGLELFYFHFLQSNFAR